MDAVGEVACAELRKAQKHDEPGGSRGADVARRRGESLMKLTAEVLSETVNWALQASEVFTFGAGLGGWVAVEGLPTG